MTLTLDEQWAYVRQLERDLQVNLAMVDSMEVVPPHTHHCPECQSTWSHVETACTADLRGDPMVCPKCKDTYLVDLYAGDPPDTPDILDQNAQRDAEDEDWASDWLRNH